MDNGNKPSVENKNDSPDLVSVIQINQSNQTQTQTQTDLSPSKARQTLPLATVNLIDALIDKNEKKKVEEPKKTGAVMVETGSFSFAKKPSFAEKTSAILSMALTPSPLHFHHDESPKAYPAMNKTVHVDNLTKPMATSANWGVAPSMLSKRI